MCSVKKYGIVFCITFAIIYCALYYFAYGSAEKEYVKKESPVIIYEHKNKQYISETHIIRGKKYETHYIYENGIPTKLNIPQRNIIISKNDTISNIRIMYVTKYVKRPKILKKVFKEKYYDMGNKAYAILYVPKNHKIICDY